MMKEQEGLCGIAEAIRQAGGQEKLGERLGVSQQAVSLWLGQGWVPAKRAKAIEREFAIPRTSLINPELIELVGARA